MDIGASNWNETDDNNSSAAPDGAPEGMPPSGLNNTVRAVMGAVKRWFNWSSPKITAGSATAYTLSYGVSPGALVDGMTHVVQFHAANGGGATLNVNFLGATPLYYYSSSIWRPVPPALFDADEIFRVAYHAGSATYRILRPGAEKTGVVRAFAGSTVPGGYLLCFGQAVSRTTYGGLFNTIGLAFGSGDGSTTFNLPDLRGRVMAGRDDMGGSFANRITGSGSGISSGTLGAAGGVETHALTTAQIPPHNHGVNDPGHTHVLPFGREFNATPGGANCVVYDPGSIPAPGPTAFSGTGITIQNTGSGAAHPNMQPTIILNYIITI